MAFRIQLWQRLFLSWYLIWRSSLACHCHVEYSPHHRRRLVLLPSKRCPLPSSPSEFSLTALQYFLSKVLEKLDHHQIVAYLKTSKILDPFQIGFRKHHCTQSALLKLTNDILKGMGKKQVTLLLQFDFSI